MLVNYDFMCITKFSNINKDYYFCVHINKLSRE